MKKESLNIKNIILIDTENISIVPEQVTLLDEHSEIVFFISKHSKNISLKTIQTLYTRHIPLSFEEVPYDSTTKNCLDFHIVAYLAMQPYHPNNIYYIYSKDKGFLAISHYITQKTQNQIKVITDFAEITSSKSLEEQQERTCAQKIADVLTQSIQHCSNMRQVYTYFLKELSNSMTVSEIREVYKMHKDFLNKTLTSFQNHENDTEVVMQSVEEYILTLFPILTHETSQIEPLVLSLTPPPSYDTSKKLSFNHKKNTTSSKPKPYLSKNARIKRVKAIKNQAKTKKEFHELLVAELSQYELDMDINIIYQNNLKDFTSHHAL